MTQTGLDEWEQVTEGDIFKFSKEQAELEGTLIDKQSDVGKFKSKIYILEKTDGVRMKFWGSTVLDQKLSLVKFGTTIKIIYKGKAENKNGSMYDDYEVLTKKTVVGVQ